MTGLACVLRQPIEQRLERGVMWDGSCVTGSLHVARWDIGVAPDTSTAATIDYDDRPELGCERCGLPVPWAEETTVPCPCGEPGCVTSNLKRFGGSRTVWDTADGRLHPGDMHWALPRPGREHHCSGNWTNCDGRHLYVVLPNGHSWDIDSRASNCTLPQDREHRCWVREGEPPLVTAGKAGRTCSAGAGSIQSGSYHGFLRNGVLT